MTKRFWYSGAAIAALMTATAAQAGTLWIANMNNANETGNVAKSVATGITTLILNDAQNSATIRVTDNEAQVNSSPVILGHIHRGPAGVAGPVIFPYPNPNSPIGPLVWAIPAADVVNLQNAGLYSNIHTQQNPGGDIRGQLFRALLFPSATTATQQTVAAALDVSYGYDTDLDLALIAANIGSAKSQALDDLSGASIYVQTHEAIEAMGDFAGAVLDQAYSQREMAAKDERGFNVFAHAGGDFGSRKTVDGETGAEISRPFVIGGADYAFGGGVNLGVGIGYADGKNTLHNGYGTTTGKTVAIEAYLSTDFNGSPVVLDSAIGYGWTSYDTTRQLTSFARTATASPSGSTWGGAVKFSVPLKSSGTFKLAPYAQLDFVSAQVNPYTEANAGSLGLVVPQQKVDNGYSELGLSVGSSSEGSIVPHIQVGWRHAIDNGKGSIATRLIGSPVTFNTLMLPVKDGVSLGASISTHLSGGVELSLEYHGLVADPQLSSHAITAGVRMHF